jgi:large subunit ribosomal protein L17
MRHLKHRFILGRKKEHRAALMSNLASALLRHGKIKTTLTKAKALRPFVEPVITLAVKASSASVEQALHYRRQAISKLRDKDAVATLFNERAQMFTERPGGYTRIYKLGTRLGDAAEMAVIQLIPAEDEGYPKRRPSKTKDSTEKVVEASPAALSSEAEEIPVSDETAGESSRAEDAVMDEVAEDDSTVQPSEDDPLDSTKA